MKKIKISSFDEEILANFGFTPESLNEMYDVLTQTNEIIEKYSSNSAAFPDQMRKKISGIKMEADNLFLEFNELYMLTSDLIEKYKKVKLNEKAVIEEKEVNKILKFKKKLKKRIAKLIQNTEKFITSLKNYEKKQPII